MIITWHRLTHERFCLIKKECHQHFLTGKRSSSQIKAQHTALVFIAQICHSFNMKTECESKEIYPKALLGHL